MPKHKIGFQELANRITGVSIPIFGVSWNPPELERKIVREAFIFLEDRRVLYNDFAWEVPDQVADSVLTIRSELTSLLKRLPENSEAVASFRAMRASCRDYLDSVHVRHGSSGGPFPFVAELGRLRAMIGVHVAYLAVKYGIDLEGELMRVIPAEFRNAQLLDA